MTAAPASAPAALEALAQALGPAFSTTLVHRADRPPRLPVVDRHTQAATEVCADEHGRYQWPWAEPVHRRHGPHRRPPLPPARLR